MVRVWILVLITLLSIPGISLSAQNSSYRPVKRAPNNISLNLLGEGSLISINYERLFPIAPKFFLTGQAGIGRNQEALWTAGRSPRLYTTFPHHITANFGKNRHFFEFGFSGDIVAGDTEHHYISGPLVGYRYKSSRSGRIPVRCFITYPFIGLHTGLIYVPFGLSIGYSF
jgi:hypothetical protein